MGKKSSGVSIDREWEARNDARTLAEASEIKDDPARTKKAIAAADKLADKAAEEAKAAKAETAPKKKAMKRPKKRTRQHRAGWGNV